MVGRNHQLNGYEFEPTPGDSEGQGSLTCCSLWGHKESDTTKKLNNKNLAVKVQSPNHWPIREFPTMLFS